MEEKIRNIQKHLNDVRHNLVTLLHINLNDVETLALENSTALLNKVDLEIVELKREILEQNNDYSISRESYKKIEPTPELPRTK